MSFSSVVFTAHSVYSGTPAKKQPVSTSTYVTGGSHFSKMFSPGPVQTKGLVNLPDFLPNCPEYVLIMMLFMLQILDEVFHGSIVVCTGFWFLFFNFNHFYFQPPLPGVAAAACNFYPRTLINSRSVMNCNSVFF